MARKMSKAGKAAKARMQGSGAGNPARPQKPASSRNTDITARKGKVARAAKRSGRRSAY